MRNQLIVPIMVDAWVANKAVIAGSGEHKEWVLQRLKLDFNQLKKFRSPENTTRVSTQPGVYVHWTLPPGFRHAMAEEKKNPDQAKQDEKNSSKSTLEFPAVPNRWLVVRCATDILTSTERKTAAWVVVSDYVDEKREPSIATSSFPNVDRTGQTLIGQVVKLQDWEEARKKFSQKKIKLTAVANGSIYFSLYQPYCQSVFSFYDSADELQAQELRLSYFVAGWYDNSENDPLASCDLASLDNLLLQYRWQIQKNQETLEILKDINGTLCHGMINGIIWNQQRPACPQDDITFDKIKLAVGSNSLEALTALVAADDERIIPKELLQAFHHGLLDKLSTIDYEEQVADLIHQTEFMPSPGGIKWMVTPEASKSHELKNEFRLSPLQAELLDQLNLQQTQLEIQQRLLIRAQVDFYGLWWRVNRGIYDEIQQTFPGFDSKQLLSQLEKQQDKSLAQRIEQQQKDIEEIEGKLLKLKQRLLDELKIDTQTPRKILKSIDKPAFNQPKDPVLLVTGIKKPSWAFLNEVKLSCRLSPQIIDGIVIDDDKEKKVIIEKQITTVFQSMSSSLSALEENIREPIRKLLLEFFIIDFYNSHNLEPSVKNLISPELKISEQTMTKHEPPIYHGIPPVYGLNSWSQPWLPLLVNWKLLWYPINFSDWQFNGKEYILKSISKKTREMILLGRTFLAPSLQFAFKAQLKRLINIEPTLQQKYPHLLEQVDNWDVLAFTLDGFYDKLSQRDGTMQRLPNEKNEEEKRFLSFIGLKETKLVAPIPDVSFNPVHQGQFKISAISVIDRFGQAINVVQSDTLRKPLISDNLKPDIDSSNKAITIGSDSGFYIQLRPRVGQPLRLNYDWIVTNPKTSDSTASLFNCQSNPIQGWLLTNYMNESIHAYNQEGQLLGEIKKDESNSDRCTWQPAPLQPYSSLEEIATIYPLLSKILQRLNGQSPTSYNELREAIETATAIKLTTSSLHSQSLVHMVGRPIAVAQVFWQLELAQPAYLNQSWESLKPEQYTYNLKDLATFAAFPEGYQFSIDWGSASNDKDGVIGYFVENQYDRFFSHYVNSDSQLYVRATTNETMQKLIPMNPGLQYIHGLKNTSVTTTLLFDPFAPVHAYTGILPVVNLQLTEAFIKSTLGQMSVTFYFGPILTLRSRVKESEEDAIQFPQPSIKGNWSWLETNKPTISVEDEKKIKLQKKWQKYTLQNSDTGAHFTPQPLELVEGLLQLEHLFSAPVDSNYLTLPGTHESKSQPLVSVENSSQSQSALMLSSRPTSITMSHFIRRPNEQTPTWQSFDKAVGLEREQWIQFALENFESENLGPLLAPEIKQAAALTVMYLNAQDEKLQPNNSKIAMKFKFGIQEDDKAYLELAQKVDLILSDLGFLQTCDIPCTLLPRTIHHQIQSLINSYCSKPNKKIENELDNYCQNKEVYSRYLCDYYGHKGHVIFGSFQSKHTGIIDVIAKMRHGRIFVYEQKKRERVEIYQTQAYGPRLIYIEYEGSGKFVGLQPTQRKSLVRPTTFTTSTVTSHQKEDEKKSNNPFSAISIASLNSSDKNVINSRSFFSSASGNINEGLRTSFSSSNSSSPLSVTEKKTSPLHKTLFQKVEIKEKNALDWVKQGEQLYLQSKYGNAIRYYKKSLFFWNISSSPTKDDYLKTCSHKLGLCYLNLGYYKEAIEYLTKAVELDHGQSPEYADCLEQSLEKYTQLNSCR